MKNPAKVKMGKKSKAAGMRFEARVRKDLEKKGLIVCKWMNNVSFDFEADKFYNVKKGTTGLLVPAKGKFNPFTKRVMNMSGGFPDFIFFKKQQPLTCVEVIAVESKMTGKLDKEEKQKCDWLLKNKIFNKIYIASKGSKRGIIQYNEYKTKKDKMS